MTKPHSRERPDLDYRATVGACVARAAALFGDRDFIVLPDRRMTFAECERWSGVLARQLLAAGIGKGSRVGIFYTYGCDFVIAWLASLRIGALVMPFSTLAKPAELGAMLRLGDVQLLLAPEVLLGRALRPFVDQAVPGLDVVTAGVLMAPQQPFLRDVWFSRRGADGAEWTGVTSIERGLVTEEVLRAAQDAVVPADLAQVTFTSGSAAHPKGVVHSHGAVVRNSSPEATLFAARSVGLDDDVRSVFCAFPFFWVGGSLTLGQALQLGWTVCCLERFEPAAALDLIESERVDRVWAWPSLVQAMRTDPTYEGRDTAYLDGVLRRPAPPAEGGVVRHRGMSETMGNWFGIEVKVVDPETGLEIPDGTEGELCVRGFAALQGYYKQEREDVFDREGWLHTGDRVVRVDGVVQFVGRYTEMIKSQGANVSPRELEVLLESYDEVRHAVVVGLPHAEQEEQVVAVVVPAPGRDIDVDGLLERVRGSVSSYKVPTRVEVVSRDDDIPWLATGKPDKRALRARFVASSS